MRFYSESGINQRFVNGNDLLIVALRVDEPITPLDPRGTGGANLR